MPKGVISYMKSAFKMVLSFVSYLIIYCAISYIFISNQGIVRTLIAGLIADIAWHIMFYVVMPRIKKK